MNTTLMQRMTKQRRVILEELRKLRTHPTAEELFELVRVRVPRISLGTVYRNLAVLTQCEMALKLDTLGPQCRFDGNPAPHHHVRCQACGAVGDMEGCLETPSDYPTVTAAGFKITGVRLEFSGLCPRCQDNTA